MKDNNHWETLEEAITVYVPRNKILHFDEEGKRVRNKSVSYTHLLFHRIAFFWIEDNILV